MIDTDKIKTIFGSIVKELRNQKGITQEELAEFIGMQPQAIAKIETGRTFVSSETLVKLCNFFEVDPSVFFIKNIATKSQEDLNYISEIKRMLPVFSSSKLREIYNILIALQK